MQSLWQKNKLPRFPALEGDINTRVLIIGGGMAGILTAYFLHQKNIPYILVEKGRICSGVTGNTTAKLTLQHGLCYNKLIKNEGFEAAEMYLKANKEALDTYKELCSRIDCDYTKKDNYVYLTDSRLPLEDELKELQKLGCEAYFRERPNIPINCAGAVCIPDQAQFDPLKFIAYIAKDLNIYENTFVRKTGDRTAVTDRAKITAEKIVVATHFPIINKHGSYFMKLYQHRSYVIAYENAADVDGMYVDGENDGFSFRNHNDLLLVGGGGHRTGKNGGNWGAIDELIRKHYPNGRERYRWAAQDCMSLDSVPYIGRYSKNTPDLFVATGFNKWGMTGAMVAAKLLSEMIEDKTPDFAGIFDPSRSMLTPQLLLNGIESTINLLTISKKRCPHLGCALKWNSAEHSWDCPCHGSRFAQDGTLLDNPANGNLDK